MDRASKQRRAAAIEYKQRERRRTEEPCDAPDIYSLTPEPDDVIVSHHAVDQFRDRVIPSLPDILSIGDSPYRCAKVTLQRVVSEGRRSDRDRNLKAELAPWLACCTWNHRGRPVSLFFEESSRIGALVVACNDFLGKVIVLTCFIAKEGL